MKAIATLGALCLAFGLAGCASTADTSASGVSPAAVSECGVSCTSECCSKEADASPGAIGEKPECDGKKDGAACPYGGRSGDTSLGAVGDGAGANCPASKSCGGS